MPWSRGRHGAAAARSGPKSCWVRATVRIAMVEIPECSSRTLGAMTRIKNAIGGWRFDLARTKIRGKLNRTGIDGFDQ